MNVEILRAARNSGLLRELGAERWQTLCALMSYMDDSGACYPSMAALGKALGITERAAKQRVKALCEFEWGGKPLVERSLNRNGGPFPNYSYALNFPLVFISSSASNSFTNKDLNTTVKSNALSAKDILHYFCEKYFERYGVQYVPHYGRECPMIKRKLLDPLGAEQTGRIIDAVFAFYDEKWATPQYPRPTIGQLTTWLANKAAAYVQDLPAAAADINAENGAGAEVLDYQTMKERGLL